MAVSIQDHKHSFSTCVLKERAKGGSKYVRCLFEIQRTYRPVFFTKFLSGHFNKLVVRAWKVSQTRLVGNTGQFNSIHWEVLQLKLLKPTATFTTT